mgnify:CR=1 FL=1
MLNFDIVGNIPSGAVINSVSLTVILNQTSDLQPSSMTLHPLSRDWGEGIVDCTGGGVGGGGSGGGALANSGDATWLSAEHLLKPWTTPGGDFGSSSIGTLATSQAGQPITWDSTFNPGMITMYRTGWIYPGAILAGPCWATRLVLRIRVDSVAGKVLRRRY